MLFLLNEDISSKECGNKAANLSLMIRNNLAKIPEGLVLSKAVFEKILSENGKKAELYSVLADNKINIETKSKKAKKIIGEFKIPEEIISEISKKINPEKFYAVRSSGIREDLEGMSFAGQYESFLNIKGVDEIEKALVKCYCSAVSETVLTYSEGKFSEEPSVEMAVIIQEMVDADISGVIFTVNPVTGNDKEITLEFINGLGDELVSGHKNPEQALYNWFDDEINYQGSILSEDILKKISLNALNVQVFFGFPCDIEFAIKDGEIYFLQARAITKIMHEALTDIWTTSEFKDGGVSATVCHPLMWSLYEYIWEISLKDFILNLKIIPESHLRKLGNMFYGRPYWNLSVVKEMMSNVPGYKERDFDSSIGIPVNYEGDGQVYKFTPKSIIKILRTIVREKKLIKRKTESQNQTKERFLKLYSEYKEKNLDSLSTKEVERLCLTLTRDIYLETESAYFEQIFINTVHQEIFKENAKKYTDDVGYLNLIGELENVSHMKPSYEVWDISRKIRSDPKVLAYWENTSVDDILNDLDKGGPFIKAMADYTEKYGYHSKKELDISYPCFFEDKSEIVKIFKDAVSLDDKFAPKKEQVNYKAELASLKEKFSPHKFEKFKAETEKIRSMLWWREEYKDISTRFYYILRKYFLVIAKKYVEDGIFSSEDDIWFLKLEDLWAFIDGSIDNNKLKFIVERNRKYYNSFRNYKNETEIGKMYKTVVSKKASELIGVPCNGGTTEGYAKVIQSIDELERIEVGDILVTKYTDTGWTSKFSQISGIVTEHGGFLCHAAIISREYGIPCIVALKDATVLIPDKSHISVNGSSGEVIVKKG